MFELERAIADWRQQMAASGVKSSEILNELESHLRDEIARQMQAGVAARQAFENAVQSIGSAHALKEEFAKVSGRPSKLLQALKRFILGRHGVSLPALNVFTASAQQTLELARAEAPRLNHDFIGTEHVLLGLLNSPSGIVPNVMRRLGVQNDAVRDEIAKLIGPGLPAERVAASIRYTPRATRALALALEEAKALHESQVSPEHIFLGLVKEGEGVAGLVLRNLGMDVTRAREEVINEMNMRKRAG
jgi:hypothetical protein